MRAEILAEATVFDALAEEWTDLLRRSAMDTVFLTPAYQKTWWAHLGVGELQVVSLREGSELVGLAPLFAVEREGRRVLQTVGCTEVSDYLDWVLLAGEEEQVLRSVLDVLDDLAWEEMDLCNVRRDSPTLALLPELVRARGWRATVEVQEVCPVVSLPQSWEEYLASLDRKDRHELRRKMRRAEATENLDWWVVDGRSHGFDAAVDDFLRLMAESTPEKAAFLTPPMRAFFRDLAHAARDAGWLQLSFLALEGRRLAAYFNFIYRNRVLVYNSGLAQDAPPALAAGIVLTGFLIRQAIEEGREAYDFLRGSEPYKYRFGGKDVPVYRIWVSRRRDERT